MPKQRHQIGQTPVEGALQLQALHQQYDDERFPYPGPDGVFGGGHEGPDFHGLPEGSAPGQELIRSGRRVGFTTRTRLVRELLLAGKELRLNRAIKKLAYYEALVIDDPGYVPQTQEEKGGRRVMTWSTRKTPLLNWRLRLRTWSWSQRSGCIPAEPYPLPRSESV